MADIRQRGRSSERRFLTQVSQSRGKSNGSRLAPYRRRRGASRSVHNRANSLRFIGKRTDLDHLSETKQRELAYVVQIIRGGFSEAISRRTMERLRNRKILKIMLFGSYERDHQIRMSVMTEKFRWHRRPDSDETSYGIDGELVIEFRQWTGGRPSRRILTVPAGVLHRTRPAGARSVNLTFERHRRGHEFRGSGIG